MASGVSVGHYVHGVEHTGAYCCNACEYGDGKVGVDVNSDKKKMLITMLTVTVTDMLMTRKYLNISPLSLVDNTTTTRKDRGYLYFRCYIKDSQYDSRI